jgi:hypothetical protein
MTIGCLLRNLTNGIPSFKSTLVTAGFALLLAAYCSTTFSTPLVDNRPLWVASPERSGYISVVGFAPKQTRGGMAAQHRVALTKARQQLGEMVRVRVENNYQQETQVKNGKITQSVDSFTRLSSTAALNLSNAVITAQWIDPANGDLYLLLELPDEFVGKH